MQQYLNRMEEFAITQQRNINDMKTVHAIVNKYRALLNQSKRLNIELQKKLMSKDNSEEIIKLKQILNSFEFANQELKNSNNEIEIMNMSYKKDIKLLKEQLRDALSDN